MTRTLLTLLVLLSLLAKLPAGRGVAGGAEPAPNVYGETIEDVAARTGYAVEEIERCFPPIEAWDRYGVDPPPGRIADSFAGDRFKAPPPAYVHPRIYFNPEDVPLLRKRIDESHVLGDLVAGIRGRLLQISPDEADWENVPYKPTDEDYRRYADRGMHVDRRMGYRGPWVGGWVNQLAAGRVPDELEQAWNDPPLQKTGQRYLLHLLPYEAFRCLIDEDRDGGRRIAAALATLCRRFQKDMRRYQETDDWQSFYQDINSQSLGLSYDWAYRWMTEAERAVVRKTIAELTAGKHYLGQDHLPAFPGNTSNWNIIHANLLPMVLAIEGEEGYDPAVYRRIVEGLRKWVYVASGPQGAPFEGLKKSRYAPWWLIPLAKRGEPLVGSEYCKSHARKFLLHTMLPWGGQHVFETGIGPLGYDIVAFKYAHPNDPVVDLLFGSTVRDRFPGEPIGPWPNIRTTYPPPWWQLIVGEDPLGAQGDEYDFDRAFARVMSELKKSEPLSYYSDYRGLLTARSDWTPDAAFLYFEPRNVPGGHTRASRNEFVFAALGRVWAQRTEAVEDTSELHSVVLIDWRGQGKQGGRCPAGRTIELTDSPEATFLAADAAWAYGHVLVPADRQGAEPIPFTPNDSRLTASRLPWMDRPWSFLPNWATGCKPAPGRDPGGHGHGIPYNPVEYAYRTVGLVRGQHPYALIIDDLKKDDQEHLYQWLMQLPDDLVLERTTPGTPGKDHVVDLVLAEKGGDRRLLVRVLAAVSEPVFKSSLESRLQPAHREDFSAADRLKAGLQPVGPPPKGSLTQRESRLERFEVTRRNQTFEFSRLVLPLEAVRAHYLVMLYPFRPTDALPTTAWSGATLTVHWPDQTDRYHVASLPDGRTRPRGPQEKPATSMLSPHRARLGG